MHCFSNAIKMVLLLIRDMHVHICVQRSGLEAPAVLAINLCKSDSSIQTAAC